MTSYHYRVKGNGIFTKKYNFEELDVRCYVDAIALVRIHLTISTNTLLHSSQYFVYLADMLIQRLNHETGTLTQNRKFYNKHHCKSVSFAVVFMSETLLYYQLIN